MKMFVQLCIGAVLMMFSAGTLVRANDGTINLYCDSLFTCSEVSDRAPAVLKIYVVHEGATDPLSGSAFMLGGSPGFTGTWIFDTSPFLMIGSTQSGVALGYNSCNTAPIHILTTTYVLSGTSAPDSYVEVLPYPGLPWDQGFSTCNFEFISPERGKLLINRAVAAEETTWGRMKALFE